MGRRLRSHGIRVRSSRNAALISLAGEIPVSMLSDLLGMSVAASVRWARAAGRDWLGYIGALEERRRATDPAAHPS